MGFKASPSLAASPLTSRQALVPSRCFLYRKICPTCVVKLFFRDYQSDKWDEQAEMKTDTVFKRAFNDALSLVAKLEDGEPLPSENTLSAGLGVSRTTVRKIIAALAAQGAISGGGDGLDFRTGRKPFHGMDAARQRPPRHHDQRA